MDLAGLTEWYSKALMHLLPHPTPEKIRSLATTAAERALQYANDHPYHTAFTALNIGLAPIFGMGWITAGLLRVIGFGPLGPIAGKFGTHTVSLSRWLTCLGSLASWYQSTYLGGFIPADSIFSGFQRLAMAKL